MQRLPISLIEPGMIVAKQVVNDKGIVLVSENTELTEKLIARLENMNVKKVLVQGCPVKLEGYLPKSLEQKLADMEVGFTHLADNPFMQKYRVVLKAHFIKKDQELRGEPDPSSGATAPNGTPRVPTNGE